MESSLIMSFITLSLLEIVLGIDNLIFIALVADGLPKEYRNKARILGLALALVIRVVMLFSLSWIMKLTEPLFELGGKEFSWKDILLIGGGVFLVWKATMEMHADVGGLEEKRQMVAKTTLRGAIFQIVLIDFVFSFDSIITAVGLTDNLYIMVAAVVVAMAVMLFASGHISKFLAEFPTFKMLAIAFILMIGVVLVAQGMGVKVPKEYIYFAFAFSIFVETMNTMASRKRKKRLELEQQKEQRGH
jgi:predicted tellurium resistance membrane protein TerC